MPQVDDGLVGWAERLAQQHVMETAARVTTVQRQAHTLRVLRHYFGAVTGSVTLEEIREATFKRGISAQLRHDVLEMMVAAGELMRTGRGVKGDPYRFSIRCLVEEDKRAVEPS